MPSTLKLITQYDAARNEYVAFRHNLSPEDADLALRELSAKRFGLFVLDQHDTHADENQEVCSACREEVERTSRVEPKPKFRKRR